MQQHQKRLLTRWLQTTLQAPVVWKVDIAIHWINHYPKDSAIGFCNTYPLDSNLLSNVEESFILSSCTKPEFSGELETHTHITSLQFTLHKESELKGQVHIIKFTHAHFWKIHLSCYRSWRNEMRKTRSQSHSRSGRSQGLHPLIVLEYYTLSRYSVRQCVRCVSVSDTP